MRHIVERLFLKRLLTIIVIFSTFASGTVFAREYDAFGPISLRTQNPVYLQSLGLTPTRAEVVPEGTFELRLDSAYSNIFERERNANAFLDLDMELLRMSLHTMYGLTDDFEIGIEIPLMHFNGGFLDSFIQSYHKFFGFPNGGRDQVPNNQFDYFLNQGGRQRFRYPSADLGLGDIVLHVKHQLTGQDSDWPALSIFAEFKFPTGRRCRGFGSGAFDFGFGTALEASYKRIHGHFNAAYYVLGGNAYYEDLMRSEMFSYMIAGEVSLLPNWSVIVQLNGSTPLLQGTGLDQWDGVPLDLVIGFRGEERNLINNTDLIWQFGFSEDVTSRGPSVDFTVFFSIGLRFDAFGRTRPVGDWLALKP